MSTKLGFWRWAVVSAAIGVMLSSAASARLINDPPGISTVDPAGIVVYPKIRVDTSNGIDTLIQLTNVEDTMVGVKCFYVNANGHCVTDPRIICTDATARDVCPAGSGIPPDLCVEGWTETDFLFNLTKRQPISWSASEGLTTLPNDTFPGRGDPPQFNTGSILPVPEDPFTGELRCIETDPNNDGVPIDRNDLKGEATIVFTSDEEEDDLEVDVRKYNAVGIRAIPGAMDGDPNTLNIGGPLAEYYGCPNIYTLNHFFEGAEVVTHQGIEEGRVRSELTVVPCAADFLLQENNLARSTLQFLIFNEFEQRFSTSTTVTCFLETPLVDIDTLDGPPGDAFSIFSIGTQGTLTGQSRIRAVAGPDVDGYDGRAVLMVLEEFWASGICEDNSDPKSPEPSRAEAIAEEVRKNRRLEIQLCRTSDDCRRDEYCAGSPRESTTAVNVQYQGAREQGDRIIIPIP